MGWSLLFVVLFPYNTESHLLFYSRCNRIQVRYRTIIEHDKQTPGFIFSSLAFYSTIAT